MIGIYQCYCETNASFNDFWSPESLCFNFVAQGFGGKMLTIPSGILNGILTNLGAGLLDFFASLIGFHSTH